MVRPLSGYPNCARHAHSLAAVDSIFHVYILRNMTETRNLCVSRTRY